MSAWIEAGEDGEAATLLIILIAASFAGSFLGGMVAFLIMSFK